MSAARILLTGATGCLGSELRALLPAAFAPDRGQLDIESPESVAATWAHHRPEVVVHAAAYTDVARAERERAACWRVNVDGTRHVIEAALAARTFVIMVSTDYVFAGDRGMYREGDTPGPVRNYYALSKLVAEAMVRIVPGHLVIRTSFRARDWPYPVAFTDIYTSQDYVDVIAPEIALAVERYRDIPHRTVHIATARKTAYELARRRRPSVRPARKSEAPVALPDDVSLDCTRWRELKATWNRP